MQPMLISSGQALEYGYEIKSICYISHLILGEGKAMVWKEGIATPEETDDGIITDKWRVQLFYDGEVMHVSPPIQLSEALRLIEDWSANPPV